MLKRSSSVNTIYYSVMTLKLSMVKNILYVNGSMDLLFWGFVVLYSILYCAPFKIKKP